MDTAPQHESPILAVLNGKGGVGKTSIATNVGGLLAAVEYRVCVVGLDPQSPTGNLSIDLGYTKESDGGMALMHSALTGTPLSPTTARSYEHGGTLDAVWDGYELTKLAAVLAAQRGTPPPQGTRRTGVADLLHDLAGRYDLVIVDCPPGSRDLQDEAIRAATHVLVPTRSDDASRGGLVDVAERVADARGINPDITFIGAVLFGANKQAPRTLQAARHALAVDLGDPRAVFTSVIRYAEAAAVRARNGGQLVFELEVERGTQKPWYQALREGLSVNRIPASASGLAGDYFDLAQEILTRVRTPYWEMPEPASVEAVPAGGAA